MPEKPLCFIVMPFGQKHDPSGGPDIYFDAIYNMAIRPAVEDAGLMPVRADEERLGGIIHKPMFERLLLCDFVLADLTTANANVFYELGVRHATRPATTLCIFAEKQPIPFDVSYARAIPYALGPGNAFADSQAEELRPAIAGQLELLREQAIEGAGVDSPLFQLLQGYEPPDISRLKTDVFRDQVTYSEGLKARLAIARGENSVDGLKEIEADLGTFDAIEAGVLVDLFLSYRAVKDWQAMIDLYRRLPVELQRSVLLREQLGFAQNRAGLRYEAERTLQSVLDEHGPSSETCGILGRVYKDRWVEASRGDNELIAEAWLDKAVETYVRGFEADWRDAYPGINAVTLLDIKGDEDSIARKADLLPVVRFAVGQRLKVGQPDYWDHATLLELAVLDQDEKATRDWLIKALSSVRESFEPETTANNLSLIRSARVNRGVDEPWLAAAIDALRDAPTGA